MFWTNFGLFCHEPDLVYFTISQIWSISLLDQFWSILPWARSGLFHYEPNLVYFTMSQIWLHDTVYAWTCHCPICKLDPPFLLLSARRPWDQCLQFLSPFTTKAWARALQCRSAVLCVHNWWLPQEQLWPSYTNSLDFHHLMPLQDML